MLRANMGIRAHPRLRQRRARSEPTPDPTGVHDTLELDNELRAILREQGFPEHVEIEFERVMQVVFAV